MAGLLVLILSISGIIFWAIHENLGLIKPSSAEARYMVMGGWPDDVFVGNLAKDINPLDVLSNQSILLRAERESAGPVGATFGITGHKYTFARHWGKNEWRLPQRGLNIVTAGASEFNVKGRAFTGIAKYQSSSHRLSVFEGSNIDINASYANPRSFLNLNGPFGKFQGLLGVIQRISSDIGRPSRFLGEISRSVYESIGTSERFAHLSSLRFGLFCLGLGRIGLFAGFSNETVRLLATPLHFIKLSLQYTELVARKHGIGTGSDEQQSGKDSGQLVRKAHRQPFLFQCLWMTAFLCGIVGTAIAALWAILMLCFGGSKSRFFFCGATCCLSLILIHKAIGNLWGL